MIKPMIPRDLRNSLQLESEAARFFSALAHRATDRVARSLLLDFARIEQLLALELDSSISQLVSVDLPARAQPAVARIKTAPEWAAVPGITVEQAIAVALDCTRRSFHHHAELAAKHEGRVGTFFLTIAQADHDRSTMLERVLDDKLAALAEQRGLDQMLSGALLASRRAGKLYERLARRTTRARTSEFLRGMVEVCALHAASIQRLLREALDEEDDDSAIGGLSAATIPVLEGSVEDLAFESALRMAMHAQKRAALVHGMQTRAFPGQEGAALLDIAEAERKHAATIASVLDRLASDADDLDFEPASPYADAPRESWTCPASNSSGDESAPDQNPPSLRLVAG